MRRGLLSEQFEGVAVKKLSAVEADVLRSNQHEFNSSNQLKRLLGTPDRKQYAAVFIWIGGEQEAISEDGFLTWYESRKPPRSEHRLYFPTNAVCSAANEGDALFICKRTNDTLMAIITPAGSTIQNQLSWLFGLDAEPGFEFEAAKIGEENNATLDFAARFVLDELGIEPEEPEADRLDGFLTKLGNKFPTTREFSKLARSSLPEVSAQDDPDGALLAWMDREEQLFRRLERHIVSERIRNGFVAAGDVDVDGFLSFSISVQNRRKTRVGWALEHHIEAVLKASSIAYVKNAETEHRNKPDFLFPGSDEYKDPTFPSALLTMLGSKSTLKDRWRQVLSEAGRIEDKHLLTLEPSISENQTDEMRAKRLQLVVPQRLHETFKPSQQTWLMNVSAFIALVADRQASKP